MTNLILHVLNSLLVFWLIFKLSRNRAAALVAALLFAVHPLRVQSVAWVVERKDVLFSFFYLGSIICYMYSRERHTGLLYACSLVFFMLSLLSKPMAVTLPLVLLLLDATRGEKVDAKKLFELLPFFMGSLVLAAFTLANKPSMGPLEHSRGIFNLFHTIPIAGFLFLFYLFAILIPVNHSFFYMYPEELRIQAPPLFYLAAVAAAAIIGALYFYGRKSSTVAFGSFFFVITILPVLQLITIHSHELLAERYTYLPSIGITYMVSEAFFWLYGRQGRIRKGIMAAMMILVLTLFSFMTWQRCKAWKDSSTFWNYVIASDPGNYIAYSNRGNYYARKGEWEKALPDYDRAIMLKPGDAAAYYNRGLYYGQKGDFDRAFSDYSRAIEAGTTSAGPYNNRGNISAQKGDLKSAVIDYTKAIELDPRYSEAFNNRGSAYSSTGDNDRALSDFDRALELNPEMAEVYNNRGSIYYDQGNYGRALPDFNRALELKPHYTDALLNRGNTYTRRKQYAAAIADYSNALELRPDLMDAFLYRGIASILNGDISSALRDFNDALKLDPANVTAYKNRAFVYCKLNEYDRARDDVKKLQELGSQPEPALLQLLSTGSEHRK